MLKSTFTIGAMNDNRVNSVSREQRLPSLMLISTDPDAVLEKLRVVEENLAIILRES